jgi:hypothetical protein
VEESTRTANRTTPRTLHDHRDGIPATAFCGTFFFGLFVRLEPNFGNE